MKRIVLLIFLATVLRGYVVAGWSRTYGGAESDGGEMVIETSDGNFAVLGGTASFGEGYNDIWLLKIDTAGDTLWTKTYGGPGADRRRWIEETPDSGFVITGETESFGAGGKDIWLIKTDRYGDTLWTRTYGGEFDEEVRFIGQNDDDGYTVIGKTGSFNPTSDIWIVRTDSLGDTLTTRIYEDASLYCASRGHPDEGSYIFVGSGESLSGYHRVIEIDEDGEERFAYTYGPWPSYYLVQRIMDVQQVGIVHVFCGDASLHHPFSGWVMLLSMYNSHFGEEMISKDYGGEIEYYPIGNKIRHTLDHGYIILSYPWQLFKTGPNFDSLWTRSYEGVARYVLPTSDSGYLVVGSKDGDLWLLKTDANGDTLGVEEDPVTDPQNWQILTAIGPEIVLGYSDHSQGFRAWVFDASGREVDRIYAASPSGTVTWGRDKNPGVYFIDPVESSVGPFKVVLVR